MKQFTAIITFISSYPQWVKLSFGIWILSCAILIVILIFAPRTKQEKVEPKGKSSQSIIPTIKQDIENRIKTNNGKTFVLLAKQFPDIQFFISGDINTHFPAYEVQILFEDRGKGFAASHMKELKAVFQPLIILGQELNINSTQRDDELGIILKTGYLSAQGRSRVFSNVASVVNELFYNVILIQKTERLKLESFNKFKHYQKENL